MDLASLDRRRFHRSIEHVLKGIASRPIELSVLKNAKLELESKVRYLNTLKEATLPDEAHDLDAELSRLRARLEEINAELATRAHEEPINRLTQHQSAADQHHVAEHLPLEKPSGPSASVADTQPGSSRVLRKSSGPKRQNSRYLSIDEALKSISESQPQTQEEIFQLLDERKVRKPQAAPFESARGWVDGFRKDESAARAWLSKRWSGLGLPALPRGPKTRGK